jgi:hypothetical protein
MSSIVYDNSGEEDRRDAGLRRSQATPRLASGCLPSARLGRLLITAQEPWRSGQSGRMQMLNALAVPYLGLFNRRRGAAEALRWKLI